MSDICVVIGTRPEAIKMAPLYRQLKLTPGIHPILLSTGQHKEMLLQALAAFGLAPDVDLQIMQPSQTLGSLTSLAIAKLSEYFERTKPAGVLVQGDTTTVLSCALAAFYQGIPIGHVEAGMRTGNMHSPWPEEMNRRLTAPLCTWNFAPTRRNVENLLAENIAEQSCYVTGNTVVDALLWMQDILSQRSEGEDSIARRLGISAAFCERFLSPHGEPFILVTGHRRESFGQGFQDLCQALEQIIREHPQVGILYPVHLNPQVKNVVHQRLGGIRGIELIHPVGYEDFVWLMSRCYLIATDSGGVQGEAPSLGKPVLVTRDTTEYPEGIEAGTCQLVGTRPESIVSHVSRLLTDKAHYQARCGLANPYGDGQACERIAKIVAAGFGQSKIPVD